MDGDSSFDCPSARLSRLGGWLTQEGLIVDGLVFVFQHLGRHARSEPIVADMNKCLRPRSSGLDNV